MKPRRAALRLRERTRAWAYRTRNKRIPLALDQVVGGDPGPVVRGRVEQGPLGGVGPEWGGVLRRGHGPQIDGLAVLDGGPAALGPHDPYDRVGDDLGPHLVRHAQRHDLSGEGVSVPVPGALPPDLPHQPGDGVGLRVEADVEEPGPGDDDVPDAGGSGEAGPQDLGDPKRRLPGRPGELQRDAGGEVPAPAGARLGHHGTLGHGHAQLPVVDGTTHRGQHGAGELDGGSRDKRRGGGGWVREPVMPVHLAYVPAYPPKDMPPRHAVGHAALTGNPVTAVSRATVPRATTPLDGPQPGRTPTAGDAVTIGWVVVPGKPCTPGEPVMTVPGEPVMTVPGERLVPMAREPLMTVPGKPLVPMTGESLTPLAGETLTPVTGEVLMPLSREVLMPAAGEVLMPLVPMAGKASLPVPGEAEATLMTGRDPLAGEATATR
ncbi:hypothetical protein GCM10017687_38650 [Streptomyces echinatus]